MSLGCGTLAASFESGTAAAASSNGKQHTLPAKPGHTTLVTRGRDDSRPLEARALREAVDSYWTAAQSKGPSRAWGTVELAKYGGVAEKDDDHRWQKGEYWNVDSNIRIWGKHEVRRNAASANHDVHRNDQVQRVVLPPQAGTKESLRNRQCVSGVVGADCCFLEAFGFDLGLRDRQAKPVGRWNPVGKTEMFRAERSYERDLDALTNRFRTLRRSASVPGDASKVTTLRPEDISGEAAEREVSAENLERSGRTFASRSCRGWDRYDHTAQREAAKLSHSIHSHACRSHSQNYPHDQCDLRPAAIYTKKYRMHGESALRQHTSMATKVIMK